MPANALFLAGQAEQGGEISILCEGQIQAFISLPTGELHALALDSDSQAKFFPSASGPHTIQCGKEVRTIFVSLPARAGPGAYSSGENMYIVAGVALAFLAPLIFAAKFFLKPRTIFSKSESGGRVRLCIRAGGDLHGIKISDPQGGEDGAPLALSILHLPAGAEWSWEYEGTPGAPLLPACLSANCANGAISLLSGAKDGGAPGQEMAENKKHETRKLPKHCG